MNKIGRVLVTGSTGRIGREVVARLAQSKSTTVRASVFSESKKSFLESMGAHETVKFDLKDPSTWDQALDGCDAIFSSSLDPMIENHMQFMNKVKDDVAAGRSSLKHILRISCFGADTNTARYDADTHASMAGTPIPLMLQHYWWGEEVCINTGLPTTSIRGNFFMNHLLKNEQASIQDEGVFRSPLGDTKNSFVSAVDMAEVSVACLLQGPERHGNKFYDITGPEPQSMHDVARDLSAAMGKKIRYEPLDMDQFVKDFGPVRAAFFEYLRNGFYTRCSPDFYNIIGRRPTTYAEYLTQKSACGLTGLEELLQAGMYKKGEDKFKDVGNVKKQ
jgi:uncharacterized protein YbjT (DUF2867 family)